VSPPARGSGPALTTRANPLPTSTSRHQSADEDHGTAEHRQGITVPVAELPGVPFPYGRDFPDSDAWADRDGRVYCGDGPYLNRPSRRLRRALRRWLR